MAFDYNGALVTVQTWIVANVGTPAWFNVSQVYLYPPKLEQLSNFPVAILRHSRAVPTVPAAVVMTYEIQIAFVARSTDAQAASTQLLNILKDFDNAWNDETRTLDQSRGNFVWRTQDNLPTEFDPAIEDEHGVVTYLATKAIKITERIQGLTF